MSVFAAVVAVEIDFVAVEVDFAEVEKTGFEFDFGRFVAVVVATFSEGKSAGRLGF